MSDRRIAGSLKNRLPNRQQKRYPFFPFPIEVDPSGLAFAISTHLSGEPVYVNREGAQILRLANGENSVAEIVAQLHGVLAYRGSAEDLETVVEEFLRPLTASHMVWWRSRRLEAINVLPPVSVFWEITSDCNLRCLHCVVGAGGRTEIEMSAKRCLELVNQLAEFSVQGIAFSGGEPLLRPDFPEIAERVKRLGMTIQLSTNGTMITRSIADWLKELDADIQVSLDGSNSEIHNYLRPGQEAFKRTIQGIRHLVAAGHGLTVGTVLSRINRDDIPQIVKLSASLGAARFRLIPFVPKGRGAFYSNLELSPAEIKETVIKLRRMRERAGVDIIPMEFEEFLDQTETMSGRKQQFVNEDRPLGCDGASGYATITPRGEVLPCHFFQGVRADSVLEEEFSIVWRRSRFLNFFRQLRVDDLEEGCRDCVHINTCGGGCRAVNFAKGHLFERNPGCWVGL